MVRKEVNALKGKEFKMYKANISFSDAKEIVMSDLEDPRFQLVDLWLQPPAEVWPNGFEPNHVHIIIELEQAAKSLHRVYSPCLKESRTYLQRATVQATVIKYLNGRESPSQAAKPSNLLSIQNEKHAIRNGRPHTVTRRPVALYHKVFDEFKAAAARSPTIDLLSSNSAEIFTFIHQSRNIHPDEGTRLSALESCFDQLLNFGFSLEKNSGSVSGGVVA
ncbi:hypothetical protein FRC06_008888 [Ceratobasidium sp. 370]|nr:hypothetical protein FRC06_008888 [Ceratobasidium sp. 370]